MQVAEGVAGVLIIDVETLYIQVMTLLAGASWRERIPEPAARVALVQRLVAVWALGGCDFVDKIAHADMLTAAFVACVGRMQTSERWSHGLKPWFTSADAKLALPMFRHVVQAVADDPRASRMRARLLSGGDMAILRAAWTSAYWGGVEQPVFGAVRTKVLTDAYGDDPPDAPLPTMGRPYDYSQWGFSGVADGSLVVETPKRTRDDETPDSVDDEEGGAESDHDMEEAYNSEGDDNILVMDSAGYPTTVS